MNVLEFLEDLSARGFNVTDAIGYVLDREDMQTVPVILSSRLKTCAGKAWRTSDGMRIELSGRLWLGENAWKDIHETFIHELAHLFNRTVTGHGRDWRIWCRRLGIEPEEKHHITHMLGSRRELKIVGLCERCDQTFEGRKALNKNSNYTHTDCGGKIIKVE
jgi:predicted SprT family Zn-dependent metalloprotease